jgi:hypothetical protein
MRELLSLLVCENRDRSPLAIARINLFDEVHMHYLFSPVLADYIWVGGGALGTILVIVIIVMLLRR